MFHKIKFYKNDQSGFRYVLRTTLESNEGGTATSRHCDTKKKKRKKKGKKGDIYIPNTGWLIKQACWEHSLVMR